MMSLEGRGGEGGSEALIRINFMLGDFHQLKSNLHKKLTSAATETVSLHESILYVLEWILFQIKFPR